MPTPRKDELDASVLMYRVLNGRHWLTPRAGMENASGMRERPARQAPGSEFKLKLKFEFKIKNDPPIAGVVGSRMLGLPLHLLLALKLSRCPWRPMPPASALSAPRA